jgi:hypothetical protein
MWTKFATTIIYKFYFADFFLFGVPSLLYWRIVNRDTQTKRQATQHDCLPSFLGDEDKGIEKVYYEEKNILYWADESNQGRTKISCQHRKPNEPTKKGLRSFFLIEFPFTSVSTASRVTARETRERSRISVADGKRAG